MFGLQQYFVAPGGRKNIILINRSVQVSKNISHKALEINQKLN